jgi:ketosteroid isomerase-like protein
MVSTIARRRYLRGLALLERGELDALLNQFHPRCEFTFAGQTALGAWLGTRAALRAWFERFHRLLPEPRFEVQEVVVSGWPWDVRLAARVKIRSTVLGEAYENDFTQFLRLRRGLVIADHVMEDTQRFERACARLAAAGVAEAAAVPISDSGVEGTSR